jgi:hypothetical protein
MIKGLSLFLLTGKRGNLNSPVSFSHLFYIANHASFIAEISQFLVLPALTNLSYKDMEISEGTTASLKFMEAAFGNISDAERQKIRTNLLAYCGQDTGGMIDILKKLQELITG